MSWANLVFNWHIIIFLILHLRWHSSEEEEGRTLSQSSVHSSFTSPYLQALLIELCDLCWSFIFFLPVYPYWKRVCHLLTYYGISPYSKTMRWRIFQCSHLDQNSLIWISALKLYWIIMVYLVRESHIKLKRLMAIVSAKLSTVGGEQPLSFFFLFSLSVFKSDPHQYGGKQIITDNYFSISF